MLRRNLEIEDAQVGESMRPSTAKQLHTLPTIQLNARFKPILFKEEMIVNSTGNITKPLTQVRSDRIGESGTKSNSNTSAAARANLRESSSAEPFIAEPTKLHTHTFILLHGLGSNGEEFGREFLRTATTSAGTRLQSLLPHSKFIFPTARRRRSSAFRRSVLTQWFDIASLSDPSIRPEVQYQGLAESANTIRALIKSESQNLPLSNIILGGLSQGCAMTLSVLLSLEYSLGGFFGMSGWLPFQKEITRLVAEEVEQDAEYDPFNREENKPCKIEHPMTIAAKFQCDALSIDTLGTDQEHTALRTPVFIGHGEPDPKVPSHLGESAAQTLRSIGMDVTWKLYMEQGHWYKVPEEIDDIVDFLQNKTNSTVMKT
ncbi:MAG: hypothetical protein Q9165_007823 [Trypethelium subeluteriae]